MLEIIIRISSVFSRKKECFLFPESFADLSMEQWTSYHQFLLQNIGEAELLWAFLTGSNTFKLKIPGNRIAAIENLLMFIYNEPLPDWYMKLIEVDGIKLIGPAGEFKNVVCGEFVFADTFYTTFRETENEIYLNKCLAVLMREPDSTANELAADWKGDHRIVFNENHIDRRAALIAKLPFEMRMAALFNYSIIRELLEKRYIWIFQKTNVTENTRKTGWDRILRSMCYGDITKLNDIFFIPLYTFFDELNDSIKGNAK
ncbi:MAG: hypothetical protein ACOYLE_08420 [Bacteroidales bacterium]